MTTLDTLQIGLEWFPERGGGLDRYYHDLVRFAPRDILRCRGLVVGNGRSDLDTNGRVHSFAAPSAALPHRLMAARSAIRHELRARPPKLVVSHFALHAFPALDLIDVPLVVHFHGPWANESQAQRPDARAARIKYWIERRVYRRADRLITLSEAFATLLHEQYGVDRARIAVIPGSSDVDRFGEVKQSRDAARAAVGWPGNRRIVLAVRRLVRRMGLERLVDAAATLVQSHPDLLVLIAGTGPERAALQARIHAAGLDDHVRLLGFLPDDDLPSAYRAADCTIVPTLALEGFGLIAAESLAAGTPSLVTPVGGLPEVVRGLSDTLVLDSPEAADIVEGLGGWLRGSRVLPDAVACRDYAQRMFAWDVGITRLAGLYQQALDR